MSSRKGTIALMGSGELTATMVEVHKELLGALKGGTHAVFVDTPAGFQLNADELAQRAVAYFRDRVGHPMRVASFKSRNVLSTDEAESAFRTLLEAHYMLIGPGSPTYALSQWKDTLIPEIFKQRIQEGACLVAASAAALTVGTHTLPVYEIYKVGQDLHWADGLHILDHFGLPVVVIPHWNNAEGGTHDTRFCYMGEPRFRALESLLPPDVSILGLDEHTACLLDLERGEARVRGIGRVILRREGREITFQRGDTFSLGLLQGRARHDSWSEGSRADRETFGEEALQADSFWHLIETVEAEFEQGVDDRSAAKLVGALLEFDRVIWKGHLEMEDPEFIAQARERFRELVVRLGSLMEGSLVDRSHCLNPLVESLLRLRDRYRREKRWDEADALRRCLQDSGVVVEDAPEGVRWKLDHDV